MIAPVLAWGQELFELEHKIALLELQAAQLAAELAQQRPQEFNHMIDWLRFHCHLTSTAAGDRINVGRHLHYRHPVDALGCVSIRVPVANENSSVVGSLVAHGLYDRDKPGRGEGSSHLDPARRQAPWASV